MPRGRPAEVAHPRPEVASSAVDSRGVEVPGPAPAAAPHLAAEAAAAAPVPPRLARLLFSVPLFYKILLANAAIVVVGTLAGTTLTREFLRAEPGHSTFWLAGLLALLGVVVTVLVNAVILRLALTPLALLERTAARVQGGELGARAPLSVLADLQLTRLIHTFNGMLDALEGYRERLREVAARALDAGEEERKRIARELHDDTAQRLAVLLIRLKLARNLDDRQAREALLDMLRDEIGEALEGVRRFARGLRPVALEELGLVRALEAHIRTVSESVRVEVRLEAQPLDVTLSNSVELALYRIVQEALSNAVRHSGATRVEILLAQSGGLLAATVRDNGSGFVVEEQIADRGLGLGLFGMQERAAYVGGRVFIQSLPGGGTVVRAEIPVSGASELPPQP